MGYGLRLVGLSTCLALMFVSGVLIFTRGFLLKRIVLDDKTQCNESIPWVAKDSTSTHGNPSGCWSDAKFRKVVIIIIDALRYDFAYFNESLEESAALPYQNRLSVIHELLTTSPEHTRLYKFIADPPTTTMQRLKGLTTGSLPTFVEAGSNFASYTIKEDNIISKLVEHGKRITFLGDDTWEGLFPNTFNKSFPFPSFNVKDLHTVDNGVIAHLVPELKKNDWEVMIGHFLGVDHCGHKYGPYHHAMKDKLNQMNKVLRSVIDVLDEETVLFVLGDHGMTHTGDHGGDSDNELDAALFVYSKTPLLDVTEAKKPPRPVPQVDFVPTVSLLLGIPIPFGNLGTVITELFTHQDNPQMLHIPESVPEEIKPKWISLMRRIEMLQVNAYQVSRYLLKYQQTSNEIPKEKLFSLTKDHKEVSKMFQQAANFAYMYLKKSNTSHNIGIESLENLERKYLDYHFQVKELCIGLWAKFDIAFMAFGIISQVFTLLVMIMFILVPVILRKKSLMMLRSSAILTAVGVGICLVINPEDFLSFIYNSLFCCSGSLAVVFIYFIASERLLVHLAVKKLCSNIGTENIIATIFCFGYVASTFSNSFVVHEDSTVTFLASSLLAIIVIITLVRTKMTTPNVVKITHRNVLGTTKKGKKETQRFDIWSFATSFNFRLIAAFILFILSGRLSSLFRTCREEQFACEPSSFLQPLSSLKDTAGNMNERFLLSSICACMLPLALSQWLRYQGNLNGTSPTVLCVKYGLPFTAAFICAHWALQVLPQGANKIFTNLQIWQQIILPEFVYWLCLLTSALLFWKPLCVYTLLRDGQSSLKSSISTYLGKDQMDPRTLQMVFNEMKRKWDEDTLKKSNQSFDPEDDKPPLVYGLGTVFSSPVLVLLLCITMPLLIILSDGMAASVMLLLVQMIVFLEIHALVLSVTTTKQMGQGTPWYAVVIWGMLSSQYFFCTGHQTTIPAIRFEAAFVGLPGDMTNLVLPGLLIFLNTFASTVLFAIGLPVLLLWPRISIRLLGKTVKRSGEDSLADKGEFLFTDNPDGFRDNIFQLIVMYQVFNGFKVLFCACSAALHRRHLMVWKIFAPRFVFESASFLVSIPFLVLVFILILRTDTVLEKWIERLENYYKFKSKAGKHCS